MSKDMKENQSLRVFFNRLWNVSSVQPFSVECSSQEFHSWPFFGLQIANPSFCGYLLDCYGLTSYIFHKYLRFSDLRIIKTAENINSNNEVPYISLRYFLCSEKKHGSRHIYSCIHSHENQMLICGFFFWNGGSKIPTDCAWSTCMKKRAH